MRFAAGIDHSLLEDVMITSGSTAPTSGIDLGNSVDTVTIDNPDIFPIVGTGIRVGGASQAQGEVRIKGGRVIGQQTSAPGRARWAAGSVAVHIAGGVGGIHVMGTDCVDTEIGILVDQPPGTSTNGTTLGASNREIFLSQATVDSNWRGLVHNDTNSYVDFAGVWTASAGDANIYVAPGHPFARLSLHGGTIFNGGQLPPLSDVGGHRGLVVESGKFTLTGVMVRDNRGTALTVGPDVSGYAVSGCSFFRNGQHLDIAGDNYTVTGSTFDAGLLRPNRIAKSSCAVIASNVGLESATKIEL